jgi:hypothetical protein
MSQLRKRAKRDRIRLPLNIGRPNMERQKVNPVKKFHVPRR